MRIVAIVNPMSGAGMDPAIASARVAMIRDELSRRRLDGSVHLTEHAGHAREMAAQAASDRANLVIVWGGDGTVNEVGAGLAGSATPLGLVPAGSGNGLAAALGVSRDPRDALATAFDGRTMAVDMGKLNDRPFFNVAGIGIDAHIAHLFNQRSRGRRGPLPYVIIGVREGCRYTGAEYTVTLDGEPRPTSVKALLIAFANGREYGMGMRIAPQARLDDGLLEACIVEDRSVVSRFLHARHLALGSIERVPRMILRSVRSATVESNRPIEYHVDGETGTTDGRLNVSIEPGALKVKVR
ncbi:MAG TPA: diacylglycerol kinase family protein [Vicinamibacterales bacterium]|jgi:YegS/Rv2252/BmrU family lipid kinase